MYGIVQGLSEFLPISSSGHLRIVPALFGWKDPGAAFTAVIQLGTMLAVVRVLLARADFHVTVGWFRGILELLFNRNNTEENSARKSLEYRMGWYIIVATIPVGVFGLILFNHQIENGARNLWLIASARSSCWRSLLLAGREDRQTRPRQGGGAQSHRRDHGRRRWRKRSPSSPGCLALGRHDHRGPVPAAWTARGSGPLLFPALDTCRRPAPGCTRRARSAATTVRSASTSRRRVKPSPGGGITVVATIVSRSSSDFASIAWLMNYISKHSTDGLRRLPRSRWGYC